MPAGKRENKALLKQVSSSGYVLLSAKHPTKHPPATQAVFVLGLQPFGFPLPALKASFSLKREKIPASNIHQTLLSFFQKARTVRNTKRHSVFQPERLLPFGFALLWRIFGFFLNSPFIPSHFNIPHSASRFLICQGYYGSPPAAELPFLLDKWASLDVFHNKDERRFWNGKENL